MPYGKIIHVDMDAFYASVEQMDNPELQGKPLAVGGGGERGVVAAASYEARKFNVYSALSGRLARERCPHLIFVKPRFDRYKEISGQIRDIFYDYTDLIEPLSLDEAFLDVTENKVGNPSATLIAKEIRNRIKEEVGLNASAGISINKFLAKVASDVNKPNGQKTINPDEVKAFLSALPIEKFFGIGKVTAKKFHQMGVFYGKDLLKISEQGLEQRFGKSGTHYYNIVRGIHNSPVKPDRIRKSIAAERTFSQNLTSELFMLERLNDIAETLEKRMKSADSRGRTVTLKIKYRDFQMQTRSKTLEKFIFTKEEIMSVVESLLYQEKLEESVRLLGISVTNLEREGDSVQINVQLEMEF